MTATLFVVLFFALFGLTQKVMQYRHEQRVYKQLNERPKHIASHPFNK